MNRRLSPAVEVAFLMPSQQYTYLNSTLVKEVARLGGRVRGLVPRSVEEQLRARVARPKSAPAKSTPARPAPVKSTPAKSPVSKAAPVPLAASNGRARANANARRRNSTSGSRRRA
jgi:hypothetical protein